MSDLRGSRVVGAALVALLLAACGGDAPQPPPGDGATAAESEPQAAVDDAPPSDTPSAGAPPADASAGETPDTDSDDATGADAPDVPVTKPVALAEPGSAPSEPAAAPVPALGDEQATALAAARKARDGGDLQQAITLLREAEKQHGEHPLLRLESAWAHFAIAEQAFLADGDKFFVKGYIADAQKRVREASAMHPDLPGAALLEAKVERYSENPARALEILKAHVETHPRDVDAHAELGDMAWAAREWYGVDTHYTQVAAARPDDGEARYRATFGKHWLGMPAPKLVDGYLEAARLLPDDDRPLRQLTRLFPNDRARKLELMEQVIAANPRAVWARVWIAYLLRTEGDKDPERALAVLDEAVALSPDDPALHYNRAQTMIELGRTRDAVPVLITAIEKGAPGQMTPASDELDRLIHRDPEAAKVPLAMRERAYDVMCEQNPTIGRFGNNAGLWFRDIGKDYEKSLKYYQASVAAEPEDQDYINDTALIFLFHLRDRKKLSLPMFEKVVSLVEDVGLEPKRGYWDALENLCKYHFEGGRYEKVVEYADKRANPAANVNGRPYPSQKAAMWKAAAERRLKGVE